MYELSEKEIERSLNAYQYLRRLDAVPEAIEELHLRSEVESDPELKKELYYRFLDLSLSYAIMIREAERGIK